MPKPALITLMLALPLLSLSTSCVLHSGHALAVKRHRTGPTIASPRTDETVVQKMLILPARPFDASRITITLKSGERVVGEYIDKNRFAAEAVEAESTQMTRRNDVLLAAPKSPSGLSIQVLTEKRSVWIPVRQIARIEFNKRRNRTAHMTVGALVTAAPPAIFIWWIGNTLREPPETTLKFALAGALFGALPGLMIGALMSRLPGALTEVQLGDEWSFE